MSGKGAKRDRKNARSSSTASQKQLDPRLRAIADEAVANITRSVEFEGRIMQASLNIRELSKRAYSQEMLDARLSLVGALALLQTVKSGVPGKTIASTSHRLTVLAAFLQGVPVTETLISEGQYIKSAAALKQDYEMLARLGELRAGTAKEGQTPQVRHAPSGSQFMYGELNKVAHPSNEHIMNEILDRLVTGDARGVSAIPVFRENTARVSYEWHLSCWCMPCVNQ